MKSTNKKFYQKVNPRQNTVCIEQQIYASPENFTPVLLPMLKTFRRSGLTAWEVFELFPTYPSFDITVVLDKRLEVKTVPE